MVDVASSSRCSVVDVASSGRCSVVGVVVVVGVVW